MSHWMALTGQRWAVTRLLGLSVGRAQTSIGIDPSNVCTRVKWKGVKRCDVEDDSVLLDFGSCPMWDMCAWMCLRLCAPNVRKHFPNYFAGRFVYAFAPHSIFFGRALLVYVNVVLFAAVDQTQVGPFLLVRSLFDGCFSLHWKARE